MLKNIETLRYEVKDILAKIKPTDGKTELRQACRKITEINKIVEAIQSGITFESVCKQMGILEKKIDTRQDAISEIKEGNYISEKDRNTKIQDLEAEKKEFIKQHKFLKSLIYEK